MPTTKESIRMKNKKTGKIVSLKKKVLELKKKKMPKKNLSKYV